MFYVNCRFTETLGPKHEKYVCVNDAVILSITQVYTLTKSQKGYKKDDEIGKHNRILFVLNINVNGGDLGNHWIFIEFNVNTNKIDVYDSLLKNLDECIETPKNCIYYKKLKDTLNPWLGENNTITFKDCPQQNNGYDCGLFAMDALKARAFKHDIARTVTREGLTKLANLQPCFVCGLLTPIKWPVYLDVSTYSDIVEITEGPPKEGSALSDLGSLNAKTQTPKQTGD